ncbi:hypothetical protein KR032_006898 [Drosophila birchii]|nr:hypothetical protein KR032_006898 [Drosophila birchii]
MAFSAIGNYQLVSQLFSYENHRIACTFKVLPTPMNLIDRKGTKDYHWMNATRWRIIESALWRQFEKLDNWEDAKKLRVKLVIDHTNVRIRATKIPDPAMQSLLTRVQLHPDGGDIYLNIQLEYQMCEDTIIVRKHDTNAKANSIAESSNSPANKIKPAGSGLYAKPTFEEKSSTSKGIPKQNTEDEDDDWLPTASGSHSKTKLKRKRRFSSQDDDSSVDSKATRRFGQTYNSNGKLKEKVVASFSNKKLKPSASLSSKEEAFPMPIPAKAPRESSQMSQLSQALKESSLMPTPAKALEEPSLLLIPAKAVKREQNTDGAHSDTPHQVQMLLLEYLTLDQVLATFGRYERDIDKLFKERRYDNETLGYMDVSLKDVQEILNANIRDKMMQKLVAKYYSHSNHTSLVLNGLLPLWIILLFADTYKLTHAGAVHQIKYQAKWSSYLKSLDDDPLAFDPKDH